MEGEESRGDVGGKGSQAISQSVNLTLVDFRLRSVGLLGSRCGIGAWGIPQQLTKGLGGARW